jgi:hypothetical protein
MGEEDNSAQEQVRRLFESSESAVAKATEQLVQRDAFGELLAKVTENTMAVTRLGFGAMDLVVRNLRIASRTDITRLARQLARTEDKLERVLQEVEQLRDEAKDSDAPANGRTRNASSGRGRNSGSRRAGSNGRRRASGTSGGSSGDRASSR